MEDRWFGNEFQILGATDENDLEAAMVVLRGGTHIEKDEEERSARAGTYLGMRDERSKYASSCWVPYMYLIWVRGSEAPQAVSCSNNLPISLFIVLIQIALFSSFRWNLTSPEAPWLRSFYTVNRNLARAPPEHPNYIIINASWYNLWTLIVTISLFLSNFNT